MTVTAASQALGSWSIRLKPDTPLDVINALQYYGHVAISTGRPDPRVSGDTLLTSARYVGVLRNAVFQGEGMNLSGSGMAYWLGDENGNGASLTSPLTFTAATFTAAMTAAINAGTAAHVGTLNSVTGAHTQLYQWQTIRKTIAAICTAFTTDSTDPVEWRINGNGLVDAGLSSSLYVTTPVAAIVRRHDGVDMTVRAFPGKAVTSEDVQDFTTDVVVLAQGEGLSVATGTASINPLLNPYKDLFGNAVKVTRIVSQSSTDGASAPALAGTILGQYGKLRDSVALTTTQFDIEGDLSVGDNVWVHDPVAGLVDTSATPNEVVFRGERINPVKLRVFEMTWPVTAGMSVAYRDGNGVWLDLTDYVVFESGQTTVVVGGYDRSLTNPGGGGEQVGSRTAPNTSIPAAPAFTLPFVQSVYQSQTSGITKAQVQVKWTAPANTDGTTIIDGDHYEIRYRTSDHQVFPATWSQVSAKTWAQLATQTWEQPIAYPAGPWTTVYVGFDTTQVLIQELTPGTPYDFQVRAVDNGVPANLSAFSATTSIQTNSDTIPPATPAAASVASSLISVQVTHLLGKSSGGTFNLDADLHHLEVHAQYEPTFTPDNTTLLGKLPATQGMMSSQTPVVATFPIVSTANVYIKVIAVDEAGNASNPSVAVQASADLIDDQHIDSLTVSKVTAGTITSNWLIAANIWTAPSGVRTGMSATGFFAYDVANNRTFTVDAATGAVDIVGKITATDPINNPGDAITIWPSYPGASYPTMTFDSSGGTYGPAYINAIPIAGPAGTAIGINSGPSAPGFLSSDQTTLILTPLTGTLFYNTVYPTANLNRGGFVQVEQAGLNLYAYDTLGNVIGRIYINNGGMSHEYWNNGPDACTVMFQDGSDIRLETRTSTVRDGGFMWLRGQTTDTTIGRHTASVDSFVQFASGGTIFLHAQSGQNVVVDNSDLLVNSTRVNAPRFSNGGNGANLEARSGGDVFFFWSGTTLNIGNTALNTFVKTFVIDHPADPDRWLVHGATESPHAGVEYWGEAVIESHEASVELPAYFEGLCSLEGRQVQVAVVLPDAPPVAAEPVSPLEGPSLVGEALPLQLPDVPDHGSAYAVAASTPRDGRFRIACSGPDGTRVAWLVKAVRGDVPALVAEPLRSDVDVHGDGPYRYLTPKAS